MASYRLTKAAAADLAAIADYTFENFGIEQAFVYRDSLLQTFEFLAENPQAARERFELTPPVRVHPHKPHMIVYVIDGEDIVILRIRHGREDWMDDPAS